MKDHGRSFVVEVETPCQKEWHKMYPEENGKFCIHCQKRVIDYTQMDDLELGYFFRSNTGQVCGRFREDQLNRALPVPSNKVVRSFWRVVATVLPALLMTSPAPAQAFTEHPIAESPVIPIEGDQNPKSSNRFLRGELVDSRDEPLIGVVIILVGTELSTVTDFDGKFELEIPESLTEFTIKVAYTGYEERVISYKGKQKKTFRPQLIRLREAATMGEVVIGYGMLKQQSDRSDDRTGKKKPLIRKVSQLFSKREVKATTDQLAIDVFPSPFTNQLDIQLELRQTDLLNVRLFSVDGRLILEERHQLARESQMIQLTNISSDLPAGPYLLQVDDGEKIIFSQQVMKGTK